jgi:hypothetical protein
MQRGQWREGKFGTFEMPRQSHLLKNLEVLLFFLSFFFFSLFLFFFFSISSHELNSGYCGCTFIWGQSVAGPLIGCNAIFLKGFYN